MCLRNPVEIRSCAATVKARKLAASNYPEQEKIMTERIALDCSRYSSPNEIPVGLASLFIEAMDTEEEEKRVVPYRFQKVGNKVISPEWGDKDIIKYFSWQSERDCRESEAGLKLRQALINHPEGTAVIWLSPPDEEYTEVRISIGKIVWENNLKEMHCYGISTQFSKKGFIALVEGLDDSKDIDLGKIRSQIFVLSSADHKNPWQTLKTKLPLGKIWTEIETKQADLRKKRAIRDAKISVNSMPDHLWGLNRIRMGAYLETAMERMGYRINSVKSGCGGLNKDLIFSNPSRISNTPHGLHFKENRKGVHVKECPYCGKKINKIIFPGYTCECGKTYQGVC